MNMGMGFSGVGRIVILVCLISLQHFSVALAQTLPSWKLEQDLLEAIAQKNTAAANQILESNTNLVSAAFTHGKMPLLEAAAAGNVLIVRRLLELGADIDAAGDTMSSEGSLRTALHVAIQRNHLDICKLLLESGADPNLMDFGCQTPLHLAFQEHREDLAALLLDYGADPFREKLFTNNKTTPFELDITHSSGILVPRMLGQDRQNPLGSKSHVKKKAARKSQQPIKTAANILTERGEVLLQAAAQRGELEAVQALLKAGLTVHPNPKEDYSVIQSLALSAAPAVAAKDSSSERWLQIRDLLLKNGASYDALSATALADSEQARQLFERDAAIVKTRDHKGATPLHWAVQNNQLPLASFWLQSGVSSETTNFAGQTPLHVAASKGLVEHVKLLLAAQAPTSIRDTNGWTPLDAAIQASQTEIIRLLLSDKSVEPRPERGLATPLHGAAAGGNIVLLAALTETAVNLEALNELGLTPLQVAVQNGHLGAAALLVDKGANVNTRDPEGNTLLHCVLTRGAFHTINDHPSVIWVERVGQNPRNSIYLEYLKGTERERRSSPVLEVTSFLLACGIDIESTNKAGQTAVDLIAGNDTSYYSPSVEDDLPKLLKLLNASGVDFNKADENGNTELHRVGGDMYMDKMKALIAAGADVNATNHQGRTPLHKYAEKIGHWSTYGAESPFQLILTHKPNVNAQDNEGMTPLHVLATADTAFDNYAVKALLDAGANPNVRDKHGRTPVHLFFQESRSIRQCFKMLVSAGADISIRDDQGRTMLHYFAAAKNNKRLPVAFVSNFTNFFPSVKVDCNVRDTEGNTPLLVAAQNEAHGVFTWLVAQGADLDATNNVGKTPRAWAAKKTNPFALSNPASAEIDIFQAVRQGNIEAAARLLKADPLLVNQTNFANQTPLCVAVNLSRTNMIPLLESHGAEWDEVSAVMAGRTDALQAVLKQKPSAITNMSAGKGLLHIAAANGDVGMVKLLVSAKCDLQGTDHWGLSPLGRALLQRQKEVQALLRQQGARENFFDAVYANDVGTVTKLLKQDRSLASARNRCNASAADIAAAAGYMDILKMLQKRALDAASPSNGHSVIHVAAFFNQTNALVSLLRAGADVNSADKRGFTPLHWAATSGAEESVATLLKYKADPNKATAQFDPGSRLERKLVQPLPQGNTPLHLAVMFGQTNVVQLLLKSGADVNAANDVRMTPLDLPVGLPFHSFHPSMVKSALLYLAEPLGVKHAPMSSRYSEQQVLREMLEAAGGKRSNNSSPHSRIAH